MLMLHARVPLDATTPAAGVMPRSRASLCVLRLPHHMLTSSPLPQAVLTRSSLWSLVLLMSPSKAGDLNDSFLRNALHLVALVDRRQAEDRPRPPPPPKTVCTCPKQSTISITLAGVPWIIATKEHYARRSLARLFLLFVFAVCSGARRMPSNLLLHPRCSCTESHLSRAWRMICSAASSKRSRAADGLSLPHCFGSPRLPELP
ncbi:hypothetical protein K402DRAFT_127187 [Aulographum hederae CBS 113979]|uniref:Uncharacterized protein n=1 Tax=Aulographum hederae CBS 113979 TaxID=1176131 RepID=A0A6G1HEL8_9PEZI|nr:hypothetical protein K402DRAFT_127187 [Aulographum hederae CBS 113979]